MHVTVKDDESNKQQFLQAHKKRSSCITERMLPKLSVKQDYVSPRVNESGLLRIRLTPAAVILAVFPHDLLFPLVVD